MEALRCVKRKGRGDDNGGIGPKLELHQRQ
jgi:hypothetical protein